MRLPGAADVSIDERKARGYLLSRIHPVGRHKARIFAALGFDRSSANRFVAEVRRIAIEGEILRTEDSGFGRKYTVPGELVGARGALPVLTVWFQDPGQSRVRLVTVRPR